jgi:hypothetical protein
MCTVLAVAASLTKVGGAKKKDNFTSFFHERTVAAARGIMLVLLLVECGVFREVGMNWAKT